MFDAVFVSDLHLHPNEAAILKRFHLFVDWAAKNTRAVYILGDFFHAWAGDDTIEPWSKEIALRLKWLALQKVVIYFMAGNRDFLIGQRYATACNMRILAEPHTIQLGKFKVLLVHGDRYCTNDKNHQLLRKITRNWWFKRFFLWIPQWLRKKIVLKVRNISKMQNKKPAKQFEVVTLNMLQHMQQQNTMTVIHGHIHKANLTEYRRNGIIYKQYVLSDWDNNPKILCFHANKGFNFLQMPFAI